MGGGDREQRAAGEGEGEEGVWISVSWFFGDKCYKLKVIGERERETRRKIGWGEWEMNIGQGSSKGQLTCTPEGIVRLPRECKVKVHELPVHVGAVLAIRTRI